MERRIAAILAANLVGYSRLMGADEARTVRALRAFERDVIEPAVSHHAGRIVKRMGDGYVFEFRSVIAAIECALAWQSAATGGQRFRIGVNLGDVIVEGDDLYGEGINIASRLEGLAAPGDICGSEDAWRYARGEVQAIAQDLGLKKLKNIEAPVRVVRLVPDEASEQAGAPQAPYRAGVYRVPRVVLAPLRPVGTSPEAEALTSGLTETLAASTRPFRGVRTHRSRIRFRRSGGAGEAAVGRESLVPVQRSLVHRGLQACR